MKRDLYTKLLKRRVRLLAPRPHKQDESRIGLIGSVYLSNGVPGYTVLLNDGRLIECVAADFIVEDRALLKVFK